MIVWVLTTTTDEFAADVSGVFTTAKAAIDSVPGVPLREWHQNHDIWKWRCGGWEAMVFPMEVKEEATVERAPLRAVEAVGR